MANFQFDATQYNPELGATGLPVGRHLVIIENDEIKKAKESDGGYLQLNLKCVQGDAINMGQAYRLNLFSSGPNSAKTVEIASRQLSAVCYAVGVLGITGDTSVLWNIPFMVDVALQKGDEAKEKGYTEIIRVLTAAGEEIKAGMQPGGSKQNSQQQGGGFGQQNQNQQQNNSFNSQNNQQQQNNDQGQNQQQQNGGGFNNGQNNNQQQNNGNVQFGQQNQNNNQQQQNNGGNNGGQWQPGQGQQNNGNQWQPRTN